MKENKKVYAAYMRFATKEQAMAHKENIAEQKEKLIQIAKSMGLKVEAK